MEKIAFKQRPWKSGGSFVLTIPQQYIKDGYVDTEKEFWVFLKETEQEAQQ